MTDLLEFVASLPPGPVDDTVSLEGLLASVWHEFDGGDAEGMAGYKLRGRMQNVAWESPTLRFTIKRHGGNVQGSTRAERHLWEINIETRTAKCQPVGFRQLAPMHSRLDVQQLAREVAQLILFGRKDDERLTWGDDGSVRVNISKILPRGGYR